MQLRGKARLRGVLAAEQQSGAALAGRIMVLPALPDVAAHGRRAEQEHVASQDDGADPLGLGRCGDRQRRNILRFCAHVPLDGDTGGRGGSPGVSVADAQRNARMGAECVGDPDGASLKWLEEAQRRRVHLVGDGVVKQRVRRAVVI